MQVRNHWSYFIILYQVVNYIQNTKARTDYFPDQNILGTFDKNVVFYDTFVPQEFNVFVVDRLKAAAAKDIELSLYYYWLVRNVPELYHLDRKSVV